MLKDLFELQKIEVAEREAQAAGIKSDAYQRMKKLKADFDAKKARFLQAQEDIDSLQEQLAAFPAQLKEIEGKIEKENQAIYDGSVGNLKELNARETQAASLTEKLRELQALNSLYLGEKEQKEHAQAELKLAMAKDYADFRKASAEYEKVKESGAEKLVELARKKEEITASLDSDELAWYAQIRHKCDGTPIAKLSSGQVCGGCFTIVTPATYRRTVNGQTTCCEKCGRVLFVEEDQDTPDKE